MQQNNRKKYRRMTALMALVIVVGLAAGCGKKEEAPAATPAPAVETPAAPAATGNPGDVLIAMKDGVNVTRGEFDKFVNINMMFYPQYAQFKTDPAFQQDIMNQLLAFKVLGARADEKAKADAAKQASEQMEQIKTYLGMQEGGMEKALKDANVTEKDIQDFIGNSLVTIVSAESKVTDDEVKKGLRRQIGAGSKRLYDRDRAPHSGRHDRCSDRGGKAYEGRRPEACERSAGQAERRRGF